MTQLGRTWSLEAGLSGEDGKEWGSEVQDNPSEIAFSVEKGISRGMDRATITITNLSPESVGFLQRPLLKIILRGGYPETQGLIFAGQVALRGVRTAVVTTQSGTEKATVIEAGAGEIALQETRFDRAFNRDTPNITIIDAVAASLGVAIRDRRVIPRISYLTGWSFMGSAARALDQLAADIDTDWTIQGDTLVMMGEQAQSTETAAVVNKATGLIGRVVPNVNGLEFKTLLNPQLRPGRSAVVEAIGIDPGIYRIDKATHSGDFRGSSWFTDCFSRYIGGA